MKLLVLLLVLGLRQTDPGRDLTLAISGQARRWRDTWLERGARDNWQGALGLGLVMLPALLLLAVVIALALRFVAAPDLIRSIWRIKPAAIDDTAAPSARAGICT